MHIPLIYGILEEFSPILQLILEDARAKMVQLQSDGLAATKQLISSSKHVLESSACTLSLAVALRRFAWLRNTTLPFDTRALVEDMAFMAKDFSMPILMPP